MEGLSDLRLLLQSQGWALLNKHVQAQIDARTDAIILTPLSRMDDTLEQEYKKGEIAALRLTMVLPQTLVEEAERALADMRKNDERPVDEVARPGARNAP